MKKGSKSSEAGKNGLVPTDQTNPAGSKAAVSLGPARRSVWRRLAGRRLPWLLLIVCAAGIAGVLLEKYQNAHRLGEVIYKSDDAEAEIVFEKDGQEGLRKKGASFKTAIPPGHYILRLEGSPSHLKLEQHKLDMDPGGRAFVRVSLIEKAAKQ